MTYKQSFLILIALQLACLGWLFRDSLFDRDKVVFNNDGPLGSQKADQAKYPQGGVSFWQDLNYVGGQQIPVPLINLSAGIRAFCARPDIAVGLAVFMVPCWFFCRRDMLRFASIVGGCWCGVVLSVILAMVCGWLNPYTTEWMIVFPYSVLLVFFLPTFCWLMDRSDNSPVVKTKQHKLK